MACSLNFLEGSYNDEIDMHTQYFLIDIAITNVHSKC